MFDEGDSHVSIPAWTENYHTVRLFSVCRLLSAKVTPEQMSENSVFHYSIPNVQTVGTGVEEDGSSIASDKLLISEPCVLISKLNPRKSTVCLASPQSMLSVASTEFVSITTGDDTDNRYLFWVLRSSIITQYLSSIVSSTTNSHQRVQPSDVYGMDIPWPAKETRTAIYQYLDRETREIDAMLAKLDELEQTLLKRRRAVILEATCQGSSTVGGPSESPSNGLPDREWRMLPLKFAMESAQTGVWGQPTNGGSDDVPCARVADFDRLAIQVTEVPTFRRIVHAERIRCGLQRGDILVEKSGGTDKNPVGAAVAYMGDAPAVCSNFILRLRCRENHYPRFWLYVLHGSYIAGRTWNYVRQTTGIQNLDMNGFMSMRHPTPDFDEQRRIADHLDEVTGRIDAMLATIDELKALLVERRAALITDVVTGRKKVPA